MSDKIPFEIQVEILKRLPVKSVIQFQSVSKTWKSLIDSSEFISGHTRFRHTHPKHLFTRFEDFSDYLHVSYVDDYTFPRQYAFQHVPLSFKRLNDTRIIGSSHGLFCLYGDSVHGTKMFVVWNPVIKKSVNIGDPRVLACGPFETCFGFGVCPVTYDPKIIKITLVRMSRKVESRTRAPWQVDIFSFGSGSWRSLCTNIPRKSVQFGSSQVVLDGFVYWHAFDRITVDGNRFRYKNIIVVFDIVTESFTELEFPDTLAYVPPKCISVSKLRESVVVIECNEEAGKSAYGVWLIGDGVQNPSFTKIFTVNSPDSSIRTLAGFRKNGEPIMVRKTVSNGFSLYAFVVYEPCSNLIVDLGFNGFCVPNQTLFVYSFAETLLLLGHPGFPIYSDMNRRT